MRTHRLDLRSVPNYHQLAALRIIDGTPSLNDEAGLARPDALAIWAIENVVGGLLLDVADSFEPPLADHVVSVLHDDQIRRAVFSLAIEHVMLTVDSALDEAGLDRRLMKGAATARLLYSDPSLRHSGDLDVVVRPADFPRAVSAIAALADHELYTPYGPADARNRKERSFVLANGIEVDLHQRVQGFNDATALATDVVFSNPQPVNVHGRIMQAPSTEVLALNAALHMSCEGVRMSSLADLIRLLHHDDVDWELASAALTTRSGKAAVRWALTIASGWTRIPADVSSAFSHNGKHRFMDTYVAYVAVHPALSRVVQRTSGREQLRRTAETLWPSNDALAGRGLTRRDHVARVARIAKGTFLSTQKLS